MKKTSKKVSTKKVMSEVENMFLEELSKVWGGKETKMTQWCMKNKTPYLVGNKIISFDKPTIDTSFYFGYSDMGQGQTWDECNKSVENSKNVNYFLDHNLRNFKNALKILEGNDILVWKGNTYQDTNIWCWRKPSTCSYDYENDMKLPHITDEERKVLIDCVKNEMMKFQKRLETYLKKYGMSKVSYHTYWIDR